MIRTLYTGLAVLIFSCTPATAQYFHDHAVNAHNATAAHEASVAQMASATGACKNHYFQADAIGWKFLRGGADRDVALFNDPAGQAALSTGDLGLDTRWGPKLTLGSLHDCGWGWEVSYFGLPQERSSATVTDPENLSLPGDLGFELLDLFEVDQMTLTSASELHSFELNGTRRFGPWLWIAGFRYLRLADELNIRGINDAGFDSEYDLSSRNNLYGFQVGLRRQGWHGRLGWDATAKAGLYGNESRHQQFVTVNDGVNDPFFLREPTGGSVYPVAFIGEINPNLVYRLSDSLHLRAGYNLLWVEGVSLAANQLDFRTVDGAGSGNHTRGGVLLHGLNVGIEFRW